MPRGAAYTPESADIPSTVEETLAACPLFRIVLIGNSGVGKSSLVSSLFNISLKDIDIEHDRPGDADITRGYTSSENPRLILHDSKGFESGSMANWVVVERFLRERSAMQLQHRVHAIWLCVTTPREGSRLLQTGEEKLFRLAQELRIPIIVVCTKYDLLINELFMDAEEDEEDLSETELEIKAEACFRDRVQDCKELKQAAVVKVSTDKDYSQRIKTLQELSSVTYSCLKVDPAQMSTSFNSLGDNADEPALVPWVITQRVDAAQKVQLSIKEGFKKYWRNLGKSTFFQGQTLDRCVWRIHDDIVKIWNLNDPGKLLSNGPFFAQMNKLVEPTLGESGCQSPQNDFLKTSVTVLAGGAAAAGPFAPYLLAAGIGILAFKFLYDKYKQLPVTARYLGSYIVDLTCVLHHLFMKTLLTQPPIALSEDLISDVVEAYKRTDAYRVHRQVREMNFLPHFEYQIAELIREYTSTPRLPYPTTVGDSHEPNQPSLDDQLGTPSTTILTAVTSKPDKPASKSRRGRMLDDAKECILM